MNLIEAENLAVELINKHIPNTGYKFRYSNKIRALGTCYYGSRYIELSKHWTKKLAKIDVVDVLLHEIAHALAGFKGCYDHSYIWKQEAIKLGARPNSCADHVKVPIEDVKAPLYKMVDTTTGKTLKSYYRKPSAKVYAEVHGYYTLGRREETIGKLKIVDCMLESLGSDDEPLMLL